MRWYYLGSIKSYYLCQEYYEGARETAKTLFENLFNIIDFHHVKNIEGKIAIQEHDLKKIDNIFKYYIQSYNPKTKLYPINKNINEYPLIESKNNNFIIENYTKNFVKQKISNLKRTLFKKRNLFIKHLENLSNINKAHKIISFDFEYSGNNIDSISEIGITLYYPQKDIKECLHFIIQNKQKQSKRRIFLSNQFKFGKSIRVPLFYALEILNQHIKDSDYIIGHDLINEFKILNYHTDWNNIIDTKLCDILINKRDRYLSLEHIMRNYGFKTAFLHNAGNDANYVLETILCMHHEIKQQKNIKKTQIIG